jgi:hypothetical protein
LNPGDERVRQVLEALPLHGAGVIREHQLVAVVVERNILIFLF